MIARGYDLRGNDGSSRESVMSIPSRPRWGFLERLWAKNKTLWFGWMVEWFGLRGRSSPAAGLFGGYASGSIQISGPGPVNQTGDVRADICLFPAYLTR
jgi:hypothetical protein